MKHSGLYKRKIVQPNQSTIELHIYIHGIYVDCVSKMMYSLLDWMLVLLTISLILL